MRLKRTATCIAVILCSVAVAADDPASVRLYNKDKELSSLIQTEANHVWEKLKPQSLQKLELKIKTSKNEWLVYFQKNRKYFTLDTDNGGGVYVAPNWERLKEGAKTADGLEAYHRIRIREASDVPYCPFEESDSDDSTTALERFEKVLTDFPEPQFRKEHRELIGEYRRSIADFKSGKRDTCAESNEKDTDHVKKALQELSNTIDQLEKKIAK